MISFDSSRMRRENEKICLIEKPAQGVNWDSINPRVLGGGTVGDFPDLGGQKSLIAFSESLAVPESCKITRNFVWAAADVIEFS